LEKSFSECLYLEGLVIDGGLTPLISLRIISQSRNLDLSLRAGDDDFEGSSSPFPPPQPGKNISKRRKRRTENGERRTKCPKKIFS
jgi:hypothetical protein